MAKNRYTSFQQFKEYRLNLLNEEWTPYDSPTGLRGKLEELQEFLNNPKNIERLDDFFIKITSNTKEMELKETVTKLVDELKNIAKENTND